MLRPALPQKPGNGLRNAAGLNHCSRCFPPGGVSETELLFPYGHCAFASKAGRLAGNHFATVVDGLEHLPELGRRCLWEGAQPILFEEG